MDKKIRRRKFFLYSYISFQSILISKKTNAHTNKQERLFLNKDIRVSQEGNKNLQTSNKETNQIDLITWIWSNKTWIFSGIGVAAIGLLSYLFKKKSSINQSQKSGNDSFNLQAGGDLNLGKFPKKRKKDK